MHILTFQTKFTLDDYVRFESSVHGCRGEGTILAITIDYEKKLEYTIAITARIGQYDHLQPDILEEEITLLMRED